MNYQAHYDRLMERAKVRSKPDGYCEKHHIIPRCLGGSDEPENLVNLTASEHYVAHQMLVKMNPEHVGISYAALLMTRTGKGKGRVNNKYYSWLKNRYSELCSKSMSEKMKGNSNLLGYIHTEEAKNKIKSALALFWESDCNKEKQSERSKKMWADPSFDATNVTGRAKGKRTGQALENIRVAQKKRWGK